MPVRQVPSRALQSGDVPTHRPSWHASSAVQRLPSSQGVASGRGTARHSPDSAAHTPDDTGPVEGVAVSRASPARSGRAGVRLGAGVTVVAGDTVVGGDDVARTRRRVTDADLARPRLAGEQRPGTRAIRACVRAGAGGTVRAGGAVGSGLGAALAVAGIAGTDAALAIESAAVAHRAGTEPIGADVRERTGVAIVATGAVRSILDDTAAGGHVAAADAAVRIEVSAIDGGRDTDPRPTRILGRARIAVVAGGALERIPIRPAQTVDTGEPGAGIRRDAVRVGRTGPAVRVLGVGEAVAVVVGAIGARGAAREALGGVAEHPREDARTVARFTVADETGRRRFAGARRPGAGAVGARVGDTAKVAVVAGAAVGDRRRHAPAGRFVAGDHRAAGIDLLADHCRPAADPRRAAIRTGAVRPVVAGRAVGPGRGDTGAHFGIATPDLTGGVEHAAVEADTGAPRAGAGVLERAGVLVVARGAIGHRHGRAGPRLGITGTDAALTVEDRTVEGAAFAAPGDAGAVGHAMVGAAGGPVGRGDGPTLSGLWVAGAVDTCLVERRTVTAQPPAGAGGTDIFGGAGVAVVAGGAILGRPRDAGARPGLADRAETRILRGRVGAGPGGRVTPAGDAGAFLAARIVRFARLTVAHRRLGAAAVRTRDGAARIGVRAVRVDAACTAVEVRRVGVAIAVLIIAVGAGRIAGGPLGDARNGVVCARSGGEFARVGGARIVVGAVPGGPGAATGGADVARRARVAVVAGGPVAAVRGGVERGRRRVRRRRGIGGEPVRIRALAGDESADGGDEEKGETHTP
jgi:hypothetical protein